MHYYGISEGLSRQIRKAVDMSAPQNQQFVLSYITNKVLKTDSAYYYIGDDINSLINEDDKVYYDGKDIDKTKYQPININSLTYFNIAPQGAIKLAVCNSYGDVTYYVPLINNTINNTIKYGEKQYSVGLMSDIHYNDTCECENGSHEHDADDSGNEFNPYEDLDHVLDYYKDKTDFICCAGDVTSDNIEHLESFYAHKNDKAPNLPFYTCKGNHDNAASKTYGDDLWLKYTMPENSPYEIHYFETGDKTSFYFLKENDVYIFFNVDYKNTSSEASTPVSTDDYPTVNTEDHRYIEETHEYAKSESVGNYSTEICLRVPTYCYDPDTIKELHSILDKYRNNRCFVFTHSPFAQKAGNVMYDYTAPRSYRYVTNGIQFALLNEMNNYYKNTIWFSGHTHYQWKWQSKSVKANICNWDCLHDDFKFTDPYTHLKNTDDSARILKDYSNYAKDDNCKDSAYNVHIPSSCRPLKPQYVTKNGNYYSNIADPGAEGAIMDVYENGVNIKGIVFADENTEFKVADGDSRMSEIYYEDKLSADANYWIPVSSCNVGSIKSKSYEEFAEEIEKYNA